MLNERDSTSLLSQLLHDATMKHQEEMNLIIEKEEMNLFSILRPKLFMDGNMWCVLYGDNLMDGIAGFGETVYKAILDFNASFHKKITYKKEEE